MNGPNRSTPCTCAQCRARRDATRARRGRGAWLGLLAFLVAAVPLAAALPKDADHQAASGALASPTAVHLAPPPVLVPQTVVVSSEQGGAVIDWRESEPGGSPNGGSLQGAVRLPASGTGYYTYDPRTQREPGGLGTRWGTAHLVHVLVALGEYWHRTHPDATPLGIGDMSHKSGGVLDGHQSHQNGLDVDIRLPRRDGVRGPANPGNYDQALTQDIVDFMAAHGASLILKGPSLNLTGPVTVWPNHDDHLHVRFSA